MDKILNPKNTAFHAKIRKKHTKFMCVHVCVCVYLCLYTYKIKPVGSKW